jgi:hypothetical protein
MARMPRVFPSNNFALKTAMPQPIDGASHGNAPNRPEFVTALKAFLAAHAGRVR